MLAAAAPPSGRDEIGSCGSELDHAASARPVRLQAPVRFGGILGSVCPRDSQRDLTCLDLLAHPLQEVRAMVVVAHGRPDEADAAFATALPATHRGERAAVAHRADRLLALE